MQEHAMPKLTDTQLVTLSAATLRVDNSILPLPKKIKLAKEATEPFLEALVKTKLAEAQPAAPGSAVWRKDQDGQPMMLVISEAGLQALVGGRVGSLPAAGTDTRVARSPKNRKAPRKGVSSAPLQEVARRRTSRKAGNAAGGGRFGSKQAKVIDLLRRDRK